MTQAVSTILSRVNRLNPRERAQVARACLHSLPPAHPAASPATLRRTLARRAAEIDAGTAKGQSARAAVAELRKLLK